MKIEICLDSYNSFNEFSSILKSLNERYILICSTESIEKYNEFKILDNDDNIRIIYRKHYNELIYADSSELLEYNDVIKYVLNNENTALFYDRTTILPKYGLGINNFYRNISNLVCEYLVFYKIAMPDFIFSASTPHEIRSWVRCMVADYLGIDVLVFEVRPLQLFGYLTIGFKKDRKICAIKKEFNTIDLDNSYAYVEKYISKTQGDYADGMPYYLKISINKNKKKYYNFWQDVLIWKKRPHVIYNKYICYSEYKKISIIPESNKKYLIFYLQYQPEQTSLPEGYGFTQQIIAIKCLRICTPRDINIYVKEHPATFTEYCSSSQRHPTFYKDINSIDGVSLVKLEIDSFSLIDSSIATVTLTGTVGLESLLRGKPVIYFGIKIIDKLIGVHYYQNNELLRKFIHDCIYGINHESIVSEAVNYLKSTILYSVSSNNNLLTSEIVENLDYIDLKIEILKLLISNNIEIPR